MDRMIVGVDGSPNATAALRWANARAERTGGRVVATLVWNLFDQGHHDEGEKLDSDFDDDDATRLLDEAIAEAGVSSAVEVRIIRGAAAEALVAESGHDDLIVVGARGLGGFKGLLLGSVSQRILELADGPVAVLHGEDRTSTTDEIVVGVDGSEPSMRALRWAAEEARASGSPLRLIHAWQAPLYPGMAVPQTLDALERGAAEQVASLAVNPMVAGLTVHTETPCAGAAHALLSHGEARVIVVGKRGHGAFVRLLLGSVSRQVAQHATVPVIVV